MSYTRFGLCSLFLAGTIVCHGNCEEPSAQTRSLSVHATISDAATEELPPPPVSSPFLTAEENFPQRSCEECEHCRAGDPLSIRAIAKPSNNCRYFGYYVGGGLPVRGEPRYAYLDGTWGWDYGGILFIKRIDLNWSHGLRAQGGSGRYKSDGPKLIHR